MTGTLRLARSEDIPAIMALMQSEPGFWDAAWSSENLLQAVHMAAGLAFVYEDAGRLLGFICAHDLGFRAYLNELIVAADTRGQGVGRKLLREVETELISRGRTILIADVWRDAESFYRSQGWEAPAALLLRKKLGE